MSFRSPGAKNVLRARVFDMKELEAKKVLFKVIDLLDKRSLLEYEEFEKIFDEVLEKREPVGFGKQGVLSWMP